MKTTYTYYSLNYTSSAVYKLPQDSKEIKREREGKC